MHPDPFLCCAVLITAGLAFAGRPAQGKAASQLQFRFRSYGVEDGLGNVAINAMAQDGAGFLWMATENGLYRFDGVRFESFGHQAGLRQVDVQRLVRDPDGSLWALAGQELYQLRTEGPGPPIPVDAACGTVRYLQAGVGGLWLGTERGLFLRSPGGRTQAASGAPEGPVAALGADPAGGVLLVATSRGRLSRRDAQGFWSHRNLPEVLGGEVPSALIEDAAGRIWMRSMHRLVRLDALDGQSRDFSASLPGPAVREGSLSLDARGAVWTATDAGLVKVAGDEATILDERRGLPRHWALVTFVDREGSLWCSGDGLHQMLGRQVWGGVTRRQGLPSDPVWSILRDRRGELWVGTHRGLARNRNGAWETEPGTTNRGFFCLGEDGAGGLLAAGGTPQGSPTSSLLYRAPGAGSFQVLPIPGVPRETMWANLAWDPAGFWWAGGQNLGLHTLRINGGQVEARRVELPGSLSTHSLMGLLRDQQGRIWTSSEQGVHWLDASGWHRLGRESGLRDSLLGHIAEFPDGRIAMAYPSASGIAILARHGDDYRVMDHIEPPEGGPNWGVMSMAAHPGGTLWIGTSQGVCRWDGSRLERVGSQDGLPGEDANSNAMLVERDAVWVGLNAGLARGDLAAPSPLMAPPTAVVLSVQDGAGRPLGTGSAALSLRYRDRPIAFTFTAPGFQGSGRQRIEVRLEGFEDAWRRTEVREARYTGLPPGRYVFQVRAAHGTDHPGPAASQAFTILPPWWRTWWAALLFTAGGAAAAHGAVRWRTRWLQRRNRALDTLVKLRTGDLQEANRALISSNHALSEASTVDALTELKNRRFLALHLPEEVARVQRSYRTARKFERLPKGEDMVFFLVDLDHFKRVNDTYGHAAGDTVLRQTADVLRAACRESDTVVRWGGEEFLVVARRTDRATAHVIARNIRDRMSAHPFDIGDGRTLRRTCSVGFAPLPFFPGDAEALGWEQVMELADQCLYAAKESGRDAFVGVYSMNPDADPDTQRRILSELPDLAEAGGVQVQTSFEGERPLKWMAARTA